MASPFAGLEGIISAVPDSARHEIKNATESVFRGILPLALAAIYAGWSSWDIQATYSPPNARYDNTGG
jgi:hypothetical protein